MPFFYRESCIRSTQTQLKDVQKLLKLDPSNTELLSQKQRLLKEAIGATKDKLESLKTAQEQAKKQLRLLNPGEILFTFEDDDKN